MTSPEQQYIDAILAALGRMRGPRPGGPGRHPRGPFGGREDHAAHHAGHHDHGPGFGRGGGPAKFRLLDVLYKAGTPQAVSDLAAQIGVDQPRASRLVQQAAEMGFVAREVDPDDARRTLVALTPEGLRIAGRFRGQRGETVKLALDALTEAERADFVRLLTKFSEAWPSN